MLKAASREEKIRKFWSRVNKSGGEDACWEWTAGRNGGYGRMVWLGKSKRELAHRISYILNVGDIPDGLWVLHSCDNPPCCNPKHLFLGTNKDNTQDKERKKRGNHPFGERAANVKLTAIQVKEIRELFSKGGVTKKYLGDKFGVTAQEIGAIIRFEQWKHLE